MSARLLLVEDDVRLAGMLCEYLSQAGFRLSHAISGDGALEHLPHGDFDAIILDLMLPDMDGLDVCRPVRARHDTPLLFGRLEIDTAARTVRLDGRDCDMTGHQFDQLLALAQRAGRILSREALLDLVKGEPLEAFDRSIDVHMSRIRAAIGRPMPFPGDRHHDAVGMFRFDHAPISYVRLTDGRWLVASVPLGGGRARAAFHLMLVLLALAIGVAAYPIVRQISRRLERLQQGVESWGAGDLKARVAVEGHDEVARLATSFNRAAIDRSLRSIAQQPLEENGAWH